MRSIVVSGWFALFSVAFFSSISVVESVDALLDRSVLIDLFSATNGSQWVNNSNWLSSSVSMCNWFGVSCFPSICPTSNVSVECHVSYLSLPFNGLAGELPPTFGYLGYLGYLDLNSNSLSGTVPSFQYQAYLEYLSLHFNLFVGTIPELSTLTRLKFLSLNNNRLHGTIPSLATLTSLQFLTLTANGLVGSIPSFSTLTNLQQVYLYNNSLNGTIPSFSTLTNLQVLVLYINQLSGTIPSFETLTNLRWLYLNSNLLTGTVPAFTTLTNLQNLNISNNSLTGSIPSFSTLTSLQKLDLGNNALVGSIPNFSNLTQVEALLLNNNFLTGTLPSSLQALTSIRRLDLQQNSLSGSISLFAPPFPLVAFSVNLSSNHFSGIFPNLPQFYNLSVLDLSNNEFQCPYPVFSILPPLVVFRSPCTYNWSQLFVYLGIGIGIAVFLVLLYFVAKRLTLSCGKRVLPTILFWASYLLAVASLSTNTISYINILQYLYSTSIGCGVINSYSVFYSFMPFPFPNAQVFPASTSFAEWISSPGWLLYTNYAQVIDVNTQEFNTICSVAPECSFDSARKLCLASHPERSMTGGASHQLFLKLVIASAAVRVACELFSLLLILRSMKRDKITGHRSLMESSIFFPVLMCGRESIREAFGDFIVVGMKPTDYLIKLIYSGFLISFPMLAVNLYYLLVVAQTGLQLSDWLSLATGAILVPQLLGQAIHSWWTRELKSQAIHHAERSMSGVEFVMEILGETYDPTMPPVSEADAEAPTVELHASKDTSSSI
jgi:Leucine-rich repeat (LRR) protein